MITPGYDKKMNIAPGRRLRGVFRALVSVLISGGLLALVFGRIEYDALREVFAEAYLPFLLLSAALFGIFILSTAGRMRIAFEATPMRLRFGVLLRLSLGGHLFNMMFFGPVGGDIAKSAVYARWYRLALHDLLAACMVDRGFALGGTLVFAVLIIGVAIASPGSSVPALELSTMRRSSLVPVAMIVVALVIVIFVRASQQRFLSRLLRAFKGIVERLFRSPAKFAAGCAMGFTGQLIISAVMFFCLLSVSDASLPWTVVMWAFPLITAVVALPFTVGGAGLREALGIFILGRYGVAGEEIIAAGLLVLLIYVLWAAAGALAMGLEERRFQVASLQPRERQSD
jgi:uncharacterized membrane protein YbhN (UPF0104 family)